MSNIYTNEPDVRIEILKGLFNQSDLHSLPLENIEKMFRNLTHWKDETAFQQFLKGEPYNSILMVYTHSASVYDEDRLVLDHTYKEIKDAFNAGIPVYININGAITSNLIFDDFSNTYSIYTDIIEFDNTYYFFQVEKENANTVYPIQGRHVA